MFVFIITLFFVGSNSLKIWIPNTDITNTLNWDKNEVPKDCDSISFHVEDEISIFWNFKTLVTAGLSLPNTADIILPDNIEIHFKNKEECPQGKELKYIRDARKGWLDPDNWESNSVEEWLPHSERVPCAGESIAFPPYSTFAVQLPKVLVPIGSIEFDYKDYDSWAWSSFLKTDLGYEFFKGSDDLRLLPWKSGGECHSDKGCVCGRSSYYIRDRNFVDADISAFEDAVCAYAKPKCQPSPCYSAVVPEGHCCGICGAVIKIEDNTKDGLNIGNIKSKVEAELSEYDSSKKLKSYVGRTKDENIQIVIIAENSDDTIESHYLANIIRKKLTDGKLKARISSRVSGLRFSNYLFNSVSGAVFGTLLAVLISFLSIYYIYLVLPKKKLTGSGNPFTFARFENLGNEENLEIGVEVGEQQELPQAFDNPMYSGNTEPAKETNKLLEPQPKEINSQISEGSATKEYSNPVYSELEEAKKTDEFLENLKEDEEEFSEINL